MEKIEIAMMLAFITALILSGWKLYAFLPNKELDDDDTNIEATEELVQLMVACVIENYNSDLTLALLYKHIINHPGFDKEHYWRFNQNRLNHLLSFYYVQNPSTSTLGQIYEAEKNRH